MLCRCVPFFEAARSRSWELVILDGLQVLFQGFVESLLAINAGLNTAVITDLEPEAFHDASEGLGILGSLPAVPDAYRKQLHSGCIL